MGKGRKGGERVERLRELYEAGDHGAARRLALEVVADPSSDALEREAAAEIRAQVAPDRGVAIAGVVGVAMALVISFWLVLR